MSSPSASDSDSDSEDLSTTGLIATRQKRATAGNLYATLRANLDDEELQKELLADEDEEGDAGDYEGSDREGDGGDGDDEDDALESSSEDEDAGPPKEGEAEDLEGEKALKRQERAEAKKKRRGRDAARLKLPASWQKRKPIKRVQLAEDAKPSDDSAADSAATPQSRERPRKKSERANWLPTPADAPVRQSARALAVANREIVHAHLKQSAERSEKQRRVMKHAAEREGGKRGRMMELEQAERLRKCERIERETAREFGRWEREEAERERAREEALAAKRKRGLEGPFVRWWSGSVVWEGERIKVRRVSHGSRKVEEVVSKEEEKEREKEEKEVNALEAFKKGDLGGKDGKEVVSDSNFQERAPQQQDTESTHAQAAVQPPVENGSAASTVTQDTPVQPPVPWLQGIQEYAAQPTPLPAPAEPAINGYTPSAPAINGVLTPQSQPPPPPSSYPTPYHQSQQPPLQMYHGWPPGSHEFPLQSHPHQLPPPPPQPHQQPAPVPAPIPSPLLREQAQRTLLILTAFPALENPTHNTTTTSKRGPKSRDAHNAASTPTDPLKSLLLPTALPTPPLTPDQIKYLTTKPRKRTNLPEHPLPAPPPRARCALTSWPAKFRDPGTGVAYADLHQFRAVRRVVGGGCAWSAALGCWVGPAEGYKGGLGVGRAARGVPDGFGGVASAGGAEG